FRILVQPQNRGTGAAITLALFRILQSDPNSVVAFFPCDHYYSDECAWAATVQAAMTYARQHPESLILLGAEAHYPEVEYGWIEPGQSMAGLPNLPLSRVNQFCEKPSLSDAYALMRRGCLWNTFVTLGRVQTFVNLVRAQIPDVADSMAQALASDCLDFAYERMPAVDFSRDVLAGDPRRLMVVHDYASGWADL